jgi:hypothetical protein
LNAPDETTARRTLIAQLFAADRGKKLDDDTASAYLLSLRRMDTPRLARVVEKILGELEEGAVEVYRVPQPGRIWAVAREMRQLPSAPLRPFQLKPDEPEPDAWSSAANTLLLNYLTMGLVQKAIHGQKPMRDAGRYAHPARTAVMLKWRTAWADDMRDDRTHYDGKLDGKKAWLDCMAKAEAEIDALIASERAAA